jgi:hypothetical protein
VKKKDLARPKPKCEQCGLSDTKSRIRVNGKLLCRACRFATKLKDEAKERAKVKKFAPRCAKCGSRAVSQDFANRLGWNVTPLCAKCNDPRDEIVEAIPLPPPGRKS